ncbi:cupin domain-containing protein [Martelella mediterranea]|uniref:cupin domain-containing protein n=1 Tax=Martelella mediterranea TaxID=293089 RepID=UPI001E44D589|nr:cupin domain-containing protein [Martelella mediterranea]MCD1636603.1 cupin domain-containing protein [Martelella mediterranea]
MTADAIIEALGLQPHPEGGWFAETFRDSAGGGRGASTLIYFLLKAGERSHWHRLHTAVEVWHYYAGAPLKLMRSADGKVVETQILGPDIANGERPQGVISAGSWQAAETTGDFTLVGCTVAPGFTFEDFELAEPGWAPGR